MVRADADVAARLVRRAALADEDLAAATEANERIAVFKPTVDNVRDWAQLMAANPRYAGVVARGRDANAFAHGLQRAGYATDPAYADKLTRVIASVGAALRPS